MSDPGGHDPAAKDADEIGPAEVGPDAIRPGEIVPGDPSAADTTAHALARLAEHDLHSTERRRALVDIAATLRKRGFADFFKPRAALSWIADTVVDVAPRIPLRSLSTLREHHPGMTDQEIADRLVRNAARTNAGIGAVGGGVAAIEWAAPPTLLTQPVLLAAETVAVVAVEIKLIGELQELYGQAVPGGTTQRAISLVQAWAGRRGVNLLIPARSLAGVVGTATRRELRDRLARRLGRNLTVLGPMFTGAAVASFLNRRATLKLAVEVRKDLATRVD